MLDSDAWHNASLGNFRGLTYAWARVTVDVVRDGDRRCHGVRASWDIRYRTAIDVRGIAAELAAARTAVRQSIATGLAAGIPLTPQEIAALERDLGIPTLGAAFTYGHERQHRVAIDAAIQAARQPGGSLHSTLAWAERLCTTQSLARRYARMLKKLLILRLARVAESGAGHDSDPATPKPPEGVGMALPPGVGMPPATPEKKWAEDRAELVANDYVLLVPRLQ